jgi:predicted PhzF superfamily epimerase YddE/YHI9
MNTYPIYQVDAFASDVFSGNPAAVVLLDKFLDDITLQEIASENNLSETAYLVKTVNKNTYDLRWFTPNGEVRLCGHATLASAHVINLLSPGTHQISFNTKSGTLYVNINKQKYILDFPSDKGKLLSNFNKTILDPSKIIDIVEGNDDLMIITDEQTVRTYQPEVQAIKSLKYRGLILTSGSSQFDFVSRCFYPKYNIIEDPVTGSAHTLLTPYWALRLKKNKLTAKQISPRGGYLECVYRGFRVSLIGEASLYMKGQIYC